MDLDSENVSNDNHTPDAANKSHEKAKETPIEVPAASASVQPNGQESVYHCEITCKPEKSWWDKAKPFVEIGGVMLLAIYTGYTIKMYNVTRKALIATEAAVFDCTANFQADQRRFIVECRNKGAAPATAMTADLRFVRTQNGKAAQRVEKKIERVAVTKDNIFTFIVPLSVSQINWDWASTQSMQADLSLSYNNGIEMVSENDCWALVLERENHAWTVTDCENARAIERAHQSDNEHQKNP